MLSNRDFADCNPSHASNKDVKFGDDETELFVDNSSCILQPEVTQGPYYVDGELIRPSMVGDQEGVPLFLDVQLLDTSTCEPVPAVFVDFWHCNSTGVYSGVSASGNGNSDDRSNLDETFLRGIQPTDVNGVVQMETIFPGQLLSSLPFLYTGHTTDSRLGHYTGRATHIHILTRNTNDTIVRTNGTLLGSNSTTQASHVGQLFFDQSLITKVEKTSPYSTNTQDLTLNADDMILGEEADTSDPFVEYVLLGNDISDGILAWISIGIDPTPDQEISFAATHYEDGGVANKNGDMGGAPGGGAPSGMPSDVMFSGMPSGTTAPPESSAA